jgi:hypothetical protein
MAKDARDRSDVSSWRAIVLTRVDAIESEIAALPAGTQSEFGATVDEAQRLLKRARAAALSHPPRVRSWWSGAGIESAWRSVHNAEALLAAIQPTERIRVRYPEFVDSARQMLRTGDRRRDAIEGWLSERSTAGADPSAERARYVVALRWINGETDNSQARVRSFRNVLIAVTLAMTVMAVGLVVVGMVSPRALPVCVQPTTDNASAVGGQPILKPICPTGRSAPSGGDVPLVAFVGLVGAGLASAVSIRRIHGTSTPYSVPLALAVLKLPSGALTALAGLILIQGEFVPGLSTLDNRAQVLSYSIILGYGQELFTRLVDRQGQQLLNSAPGPGQLTPRRADENTNSPGPLEPIPIPTVPSAVDGTEPGGIPDPGTSQITGPSMG